MIKYDLNLLGDFHKRLLKLINSLNLTDEELSKELSIAKGTARDSWMAKGNYPPADKIIILLKLSNGRYSADWLLTGEEKNTPSCYVNCNPEIKPLCEKLKSVIDSETKYAKVLKENIEAFDLAVKDGLEASGNRRRSDKEIADLKARIEHLEKMFELKLNTDTD